MRQGVKDRWCWGDSLDSRFSVNKAYKMLSRNVVWEGEEKEEFKITWSNPIPSKIQVHAWRVLWEQIPTSSKLLSQNALSSHANTRCAFCNILEETVRHVLFECEFAYNFWMKCVDWFEVVAVLPSDPMRNLLLFSRLLNGKEDRKFAIYTWECVVWLLWKTRNAIILEMRK